MTCEGTTLAQKFGTKVEVPLADKYNDMRAIVLFFSLFAVLQVSGQGADSLFFLKSDQLSYRHYAANDRVHHEAYAPDGAVIWFGSDEPGKTLVHEFEFNALGGLALVTATMAHNGQSATHVIAFDEAGRMTYQEAREGRRVSTRIDYHYRPDGQVYETISCSPPLPYHNQDE